MTSSKTTSPTPSKIKAVFDSSPLVFLDALGYIHLLPQLHEVFITSTVAAELTFYPKRFGARVAELPWVRQQSPVSATLMHVQMELNADLGEQTAIALALDLSALVVTDDAKARHYAAEVKLLLTGTLGLLLRLHTLKLASRTIAEDLAVLEENNMRVAGKVKELILERAARDST